MPVNLIQCAPAQRAVPFPGPLADGRNGFTTGESPIMASLRQHPDRMPFAQLPERINATHCEGPDVD